MQERVRFIADYRSGLYSMTELCEQFRVSRKTGYKWIRRFEEEGAEGLRDRSRAPYRCDHRIPDGVADDLVRVRRRHPTWGPKKLIAWCEARWPAVDWPAPSTVGELLRREGLIRARRRNRRPTSHPGRPRVEALGPNDVWTADYKGQFRVRNWGYCYPLTIADRYSRYLVGLQALDGTCEEDAKPVFERAFGEFGLPLVILTDNGSPFVAPRGLQGLTRLSVWWMSLGIRPVRIEPGHPEQNGAHERMHRTLKAETTRPPAGNRGVQQRRFNQFRRIYNEERPHEALGQVPPAQVWQPSARAFPEQIPLPEYPEHYEKRWVSAAGSFVMHRQPIYLSTALEGRWIGLDETGDGIRSIYFRDALLGRYHEEERKVFW